MDSRKLSRIYFSLPASERATHSFTLDFGFRKAEYEIRAMKLGCIELYSLWKLSEDNRVNEPDVMVRKWSEVGEFDLFGLDSSTVNWGKLQVWYSSFEPTKLQVTLYRPIELLDKATIASPNAAQQARTSAAPVEHTGGVGGPSMVDGAKLIMAKIQMRSEDGDILELSPIFS